MSEFDPGVPASDREDRSTRRAPDAAENELPREREQGSARQPGSARRNELPGEETLTKAIARISTAQKGSITHAQLTQAGLRRSAIGRRSDTGSIHRIHRGVYLLGHEALAQFARETAALLAAGDGAVISHVSAGFLWGLAAFPAPDDDVHITVVDRKIRSRPGLRAHRSSTLDPLDVRRVHGLPVTAPARTLLDLAAAGYPDLERAFAEAHAQRLLNASALEQVIRRAGPRPGVRALRALISDNASGFTRSEAERLLRRAIRSSRLPQPDFNVPFGRYELDAVWPERRVVVEVDGYDFHGHRAQFERDRRKDMALTAAGYRVIRLTYRQLTKEPLAVVAVIAIALSPGRNPG